MTDNTIQGSELDLEARLDRIETKISKFALEIVDIVDTCQQVRTGKIELDKFGAFSYIDQYREIGIKLYAIRYLVQHATLGEDYYTGLEQN